MYFNRNSEIGLMEIIIHQAVATYEPWLRRVARPYWEGDERSLDVGNIALHIPESWPRSKLQDHLPDWLKKRYSLEELDRKVDPSAPAALYQIGQPHEEKFDELIVGQGGMQLLIVEAIRLHLMASAAFSACQHGTSIAGEHIHEVARWKCWAWPFC